MHSNAAESILSSPCVLAQGVKQSVCPSVVIVVVVIHRKQGYYEIYKSKRGTNCQKW